MPFLNLQSMKCTESEEEEVTKGKENQLQLSCFINQEVKYLFTGLKLVRKSWLSLICGFHICGYVSWLKCICKVKGGSLFSLLILVFRIYPQAYSIPKYEDTVLCLTKKAFGLSMS